MTATTVQNVDGTLPASELVLLNVVAQLQILLVLVLMTETGHASPFFAWQVASSTNEMFTEQVVPQDIVPKLCV